MSFETITLNEVVQRIQERRRDSLGVGTATAGASTSLTDAVVLGRADANSLAGAWIYTTGGTGPGQEREITASTTGGVVTVATWGVTTDNTTTYEVTRTRKPTEYRRMVYSALRASRRNQLSYLNRRAILTGAQPGLDGLMSHWSSDTAFSGSTYNWQATGASGNDTTREYFNKIRGDYACIWLIDTGTVGTFYTPTADKWLRGLDPGDKISIEAVVFATGTRGATLTFAETGNDFTISDAETHGGTGWEVIKADVTLATNQANPPTGQFGLSMPTGSGAVKVIIDSIYIPTNNNQIRYLLPGDFATIDNIRVHQHSPSSTDGSVSDEIPSRDWESWRTLKGAKTPEANPAWLPTDEANNTLLEFTGRPADNLLVEIAGMGVDANLREGQLADSENMLVNVELIIEYCKWRFDQDQDAANNYFTLLSETRVDMPENSMMLEAL
jgi:hypothetical protein